MSAPPERPDQSSLLDSRAAWIDAYRPAMRIRERGRIVSVGDGIAWISGLPSAAIDELLVCDDGSRARVFDLSESLIGALLLHETDQLAAGVEVRRSNAALGVPVGDRLIGRVIDPLGQPLDGRPLPAQGQSRPVENAAPPIIARDFVRAPLYTGIRVIDAMIPIGKGQRQLIVGDEGLGRSSIAIDTIINQRDKGVLCVYVLIGQKRSTVVNTIATLRDFGAMEYTTVVVGEANALPGLQHIAPFAGCAVGEYWMLQGRDVLIVYDDLSTHARTYRELSLLIRRPPGREAYPGDIFSIHAQLLERATCFNASRGGGSLTALPIIETLEGEIASYVPTNLISITDGQVFLDRALFAAGFRPAIDVRRSVSRIGGEAQHPKIKKEAGRMKLDYLSFLELEVFTRFGARLEASVEETIARGRLLSEILKQERLKPGSPVFQLAWLIAFNDHRLDHLGPEDARNAMEKLAARVDSTSLDLDSPREEWAEAIEDWLSAPDDGESKQ
jgi:F-type H+-transporting ATPase subunit alpha